jgi:hypothetical protein
MSLLKTRVAPGFLLPGIGLHLYMMNPPLSISPNGFEAPCRPVRIRKEFVTTEVIRFTVSYFALFMFFAIVPEL